MLEDIFDDIIPDDDDEDTILYKEEFTETLLQLMEEYITKNPTAIMEPDFHEIFVNDIQELVMSQFSPHYICSYEEDDLEEIIEDTTKIFYELFMPIRSHNDSIIIRQLIDDKEIKKIENQIQYLLSIPQPEQRTPEWYTFRHNLITASNAYKAFGSESKRNELIWDKCQEMQGQVHSLEQSLTSTIVDNTIVDSNIHTIITNPTNPTNYTGPNVNTSLHWGQKYEPVSVMIYENMYNTKIQEFGCIQHSKYKFLGASPDGINDYWVQMQIQMETCNLDECDFLEIKIVEYEDEKAYIEDKDTPKNCRGVIMYFSNPHLYKYASFSISSDPNKLAEWEALMMEENKNNIWIKNIYWKTDIVSCVLVERNRKWFQDNINELENVWKIIERERKTGFQHRAPAKRVKKEDDTLNTTLSTKSFTQLQGCLLNLNKESGKIQINNSNNSNNNNSINNMSTKLSKSPPNQSVSNFFTKVIKVRTQSFDEAKNTN